MNDRKPVTAKDVQDYLDNAIASFAFDPADSDYQRGYLAALSIVRSDLFFTSEERATEYAKSRTA